MQAICDWVHAKVNFGYQYARPTKTALDVFGERSGVCRDFQHLAVTLCRALHIPARYATGYLGDIRVPAAPSPMDFRAWFEVYLEDRWWTFDARYNFPRFGRVLMATGRDASDSRDHDFVWDGEPDVLFRGKRGTSPGNVAPRLGLRWFHLRKGTHFALAVRKCRGSLKFCNSR